MGLDDLSLERLGCHQWLFLPEDRHQLHFVAVLGVELLNGLLDEPPFGDHVAR